MPNASYQAAACLVEREAGAFFSGGRSRSAGTWKRARSLCTIAMLAPSLPPRTSPARCAQDRHHVRTGQAVLIHEVADQIACARRPARPFTLLIGGDQTRLRLEASNVSWKIRLPEPINEYAGANEFRIAINQD